MENPQNILFIKLGEKGSYEKYCIENNKMKLGYQEINHNNCLSGRWDDVYSQIEILYRTVKTASTSHKNQIKKFYEEPESTMWITFYNGKLWYCYAESEITYNHDGTKERNVIGSWRDCDSQGNTLFIQYLSGRLTKVQGFRGTICEVKEKEYLLHKINNTQSIELSNVERDLKSLRVSIQLLIKKLNPKDFEVFIDLLFRSAGWSRIGALGKEIKTIDIELLAPVTNEKAIVQVKSQSSYNVFREYRERLLEMMEYDKYFFVTHTPDKKLAQYIESKEEELIEIWDSAKLAEFSINAGLIEWLINVAP